MTCERDSRRDLGNLHPGAKANKTASHARCPATAVISSKRQISHVKSKESCKVPVKFQKDWPKTVGGVADTRHILPIHICSIKA